MLLYKVWKTNFDEPFDVDAALLKTRPTPTTSANSHGASANSHGRGMSAEGFTQSQAARLEIGTFGYCIVGGV